MFLRAVTLRRVARFALLAVLLHAFAPFAHAMVRTAARLPVDPLGSICRVVLPGDISVAPATGPAPQDSAAVDMARMCPLCVAGAHFALATDTATVLPLDEQRQHERIVQAAGSVPPVFVWHFFLTRAPPGV